MSTVPSANRIAWISNNFTELHKCWIIVKDELDGYMTIENNFHKFALAISQLVDISKASQTRLNDLDIEADELVVSDDDEYDDLLE